MKHPICKTCERNTNKSLTKDCVHMKYMKFSEREMITKATKCKMHVANESLRIESKGW